MQEVVHHELLREFTTRVLVACGVPDADAELSSRVLLASDLRGIESHGVARLHLYVDWLAKGKINPRAQIKVLRETGSTALVDGDNGLGLVVGPKANLMAMEKAVACGSGWVSVRNSNHYGIAGYYPLQALQRDIIGWSMTNASAQVTPIGGAESMLGTNPIAIAFPGQKEPPIVIDMSTAVVAYGKIEIAHRKKTSLGPGWATDEEGRPTVDPQKMMFGGALLPLGSTLEQGGHKGTCLAVMVDMLTAVLSGANWGPFVQPFANRNIPTEKQVGKGIGHFFGALQIEGFMDAGQFKNEVDAWIRTMRKTKPAAGSDKVRIPGDPEREAEDKRTTEGIPLLPPVVANLEKVAEKTGVPFPSPSVSES